MRTRVIGFAPPDDKWKQMKAVWDACELAGVSAPPEVIEFFDGEEPDEQGIEVNLEDHECITKYNEESREGYEVEVKKIPANVQYIRFYNAY